jgi:pyruvate/2-oxoglutarate dehydrogenase complex dihydrolipoamide dehydrogenase (E3) component
MNPSEAFDLVVIGGGPAGLAGAREALQMGARVALIERVRLGGRSLAAGGAPSKSLIRTGRLYEDMRNAENYGARSPDETVPDFARAMARMRAIVARLARYDSPEQLRLGGIDLTFGDAHFLDRETIAVDQRRLAFGKALLATGARPTVPNIGGLKEAGFLTIDALFQREEGPRRLAFLGAGPRGCELAQALRRLGVEVYLVHNEPMFWPHAERDAATLLGESLRRDGVRFHLNTEVRGVARLGHARRLELDTAGHRFTIDVDEIVLALGAQPNIEGLDAHLAHVDYDQRGVSVDEYCRTTNKNVFAAGDLCSTKKYANAAEAMARLAIRNALGASAERQNARLIPQCAYTDPEVAHIGLEVREAFQLGIGVDTFTVLMQDVDRAICDGEDEGFVKIHLKHGSDEILGATIVARHAGEMLQGISLAMTQGVGLRALAATAQPYPTQAGAIKMAADAFCRSRLAKLS